MADKNTLQKHDQAITALADKMGVVEEFQTSTAEQLQQMRDQFSSENKDLKNSISELMEMMKLQAAGKQQLLEGGSSNKQQDLASKMVQHSCSTPSHYAIANDNLRIHDVDSTMRTQRPPPGINPHFDLNTRTTSNQMPELGLLTLPHSVQSGTPPFNPHSNPHSQIPPATPINVTLLPPYLHTTLNPYAPPLYIHNSQPTMASTNPSYHIPVSQPTIPPFYHPATQWNPSDQGFHRTINTNPTIKTPKFDFPRFNGQDPRGWLTKCEKYFQLIPTPDLRARVFCAALHMEGDADIWYRTIEEEKTNLLWPEFSRLVCQRFSKSGYENIVGQFNKLVQRGSVDEYINKFDELRNYVMLQEGFHRESYYIDNFISGLK